MFPRSFFLQLIEKDFSEFVDFIKKSNDEELRQLLGELHPADIADLVERVGDEEKARLMELLDNKLAAEVLSLIEEHHQPEVLDAISEEKLPKIIDEMESDDAADILEDLPKKEAAEILDAMPKEESETMRQLLTYPPDTAGGLMQTELVSIPPEMTMGETVRLVREKFNKVGDIINVYVVNPENILLGIIPLRSLILELAEKKVSDVMEKNVISAPVEMDQEKVAELFRKYDFISLPVVDSQNHLIGRILVDDIMDVMQEEASEDIYRLAGVDKEEHVDDSAGRSVKLRLPWLTINLATAFLAAAVVGLFENTIQKVVALAVYMPIVAGMGGNAGTQSLTVITRGLALGELKLEGSKKVFIKELLSGLFNGLILGVLTGVLAYWWDRSPMLGVVIGLAMISNMIVAAATGTLIPLFLKWIHVDPALASSVIVTTFTDCCGFFSFLGLATLFLRFLA